MAGRAVTFLAVLVFVFSATSAAWATPSEPKLIDSAAVSPTVSCSSIPEFSRPVLLSPANGANLDTIAPLFDVGYDTNMVVDNMAVVIHVATDISFNGPLNVNMALSSDHRSWRFPTNLVAGQQYYWRAFLICREDWRSGPYTEPWTFVAGSSGILPPIPQLVRPADNALVPEGESVMSWATTLGAVDYLPKWNKSGVSSYSFRWNAGLEQSEPYLEPGVTYEWRVAARSFYGIGPESPTRTFTVGSKSTQVEPSGGALTYIDSQGSQTSFQFPVGAVSQTTLVTITLSTPPATPGGFSWAKHAFVLEASQNGQIVTDLVFSQPVAVTIHYTDADLAGMTEDTLALMYWNEAQMQWSDSACGPYERHLTENWLTVPICHLSSFGLFGTYPYSIHLPLVLNDATW